MNARRVALAWPLLAASCFITIDESKIGRGAANVTDAGAGEANVGDAPSDAAAGPTDQWQPRAFDTTSDTANGCSSGPRYVRFNVKYNVWVGAASCTPSTYKLFMSLTREGPYSHIGDEIGGGEDHCELVDPTFRLADDGDITTSSCPTCELGSWQDVGGPMFKRAKLGDPFVFVVADAGTALTAPFYQCGVTIP